ncbi:3'-5' exonuclease [Pedobacter agri]|uniref:3'-5' exonuclease n=1 Tax=Pedobacter agri TaxID=454586 RepID=UPI002781678C|nr:3'-5' exonuclease [Pedobacter agri]MDQ1140114.1 superfamily I DNA/RNA helicase [Pedobacter agri]
MPDFRFRLPAINDLTFTQQIALAEREKSLLVTGGPGSGKTVVSVYRFQRDLAQDDDVLFFTYHKTLIASIRGTFRQRADILMPDVQDYRVERILNNSIYSFTAWYYRNFQKYLPEETDEEIVANILSLENETFYNFSEIFIDEAQDLRPAVLDALIVLTNRMTCGADRAQDLNGHYIQPADEFIRTLLINRNREVNHQELTQNFRNTKQIFAFARKFVPEDIGVQEIDIEELNDGNRPEVMELTQVEQLALIARIIRDNPNANIGILVHFYWQINDIRDYLIANGFSCEENADEADSFSYYYVNNSMNPQHEQIMERNLRTPFIITFDSCKGLEFDTVIMPMFEQSDWAMTNPKKKYGSQEVDTFANGDIKYFASRNHYYVACTRARGQLYILYSTKPDILGFYEEDDVENVDVDLLF